MSAMAAVAVVLLVGVIVLAVVLIRTVGRRAATTVAKVHDLLERNEARFRAMVRDSNDIMAILDADGTLKYSSPATERVLGLDIEPLLGTSIFDLVHPDDRERAARALRVTADGGITDRVELRLHHAEGGWRVVEAVATNLLDDPAVEGIVISARDLTERRRAEAELREAQERFRSAFEHAPIGMALITLDGRLFRVNRALASILGRGESDLLKTSMLELSHPDDRDACRESVERLLSGHSASCQFEQRYLHHDGHPVWVAVSVSIVHDAGGRALYLVSQIEDITTRKAADEALAHQAVHDPLTGLPNRRQFVERLGAELARASMRNERVGVLFLDVDRFKVVNDSLGHSAGDRLLVAIADRLRSAMGPQDVVARFGGDEFTVLCPNAPSEETVELVAERIATAVAKPVALVEGEVFVTASIGIAMSGNETDTPDVLLRNADSAMYRAKEMGRARTELFETGAHHRAVTHLRTGNELHRALERGELRLHYQPIVSVVDGDLSGFEALIRWEHPERGLVPPMDFVPLAEETGQIVPIGVWALEEAARQAAAWHAAAPNGRRLSMSVNLSPRQLLEPSLANDVARVLHETGLQPSTLWLEITETTIMRDTESAIGLLGALRSLGLHVAVDDFGSGYSSLGYLGRLPVEALKIDRSFIQGVGEQKECTTIVHAIVSLARALGLSTVAEGIETPGQLRTLREMRCERAQGYLFGPAMPAEEFGDDPIGMMRERAAARRAGLPSPGVTRPVATGEPAEVGAETT